MRVSVDVNDSGYVHDNDKYTVFLDGELLSHCITADTDKDEALVYQLDSDGYAIVDKGKQEALTEKVYGKITIHKVD